MATRFGFKITETWGPNPEGKTVKTTSISAVMKLPPGTKGHVDYTRSPSKCREILRVFESKEDAERAYSAEMFVETIESFANGEYEKPFKYFLGEMNEAGMSNRTIGRILGWKTFMSHISESRTKITARRLARLLYLRWQIAEAEYRAKGFLFWSRCEKRITGSNYCPLPFEERTNWSRILAEKDMNKLADMGIMANDIAPSP